MRLSEIQKEIHANAVRHGWWACKMCEGSGEIDHLVANITTLHSGSTPCPQCNGSKMHRDSTESIVLIHAELSEAVEALRLPGDLDQACDKCNGIEDVCTKCNGSGKALGGSRYAEELADAVIRILDEAEFRGINLESVIREKHAYNITRAYKHGKRF